MTAMRVTHVLDTGVRAVELDPGVFALEGASVTTGQSLNAHGVTVTSLETTDTIEVTENSLAYAERIIDGQRRIARRMSELEAQ